MLRHGQTSLAVQIAEINRRAKAYDGLVAQNKAMRRALLPFAEQPASEDSICHAGLVPMRECGRCSKILAARAALTPQQEIT